MHGGERGGGVASAGGRGRKGRQEANLVSKRPLFMTTLLLLLKAPCSQHMPTFDKAEFQPPPPHKQTRFSKRFCRAPEMRALTNELFAVCLRVGVSDGGRSYFPGQQREERRGKDVAESRLSSRLPTSSTQLSRPAQKKHDPPLPLQPPQKHRRLDKHYFMR